MQLTRITKKDNPTFIVTLLLVYSIYEKNVPNISQQTSVVILIPFEISSFTIAVIRYVTHNINERNINIPPVTRLGAGAGVDTILPILLSILLFISVYICYKISIYKN